MGSNPQCISRENIQLTREVKLGDVTEPKCSIQEKFTTTKSETVDNWHVLRKGCWSYARQELDSFIHMDDSCMASWVILKEYENSARR